MHLTRTAGLDWRRWALYACLAAIFTLAIAGPLHLHDKFGKDDAGCTLCHAGQQTVGTQPATEAGKPLEVTFVQLLMREDSLRSLDEKITTSTPRAPPLTRRSSEGWERES